MSEAKVHDTKPMVMKIDAGKHFYCACGRSSNQPFCDGSHKETSITPMVFEIEEPRTVAMCMCRTTGTPPFCDGSHNDL